MTDKKLKILILSLISIVWIIIFIFFSNDAFIKYECCDELQYLNDFGIAIINALPFLSISIILIVSIALMRIDFKILFFCIFPIIILNLMGFVLMILVYKADKSMINQVNNMLYYAIEDALYVILFAMVTLSGLIKCLIFNIKRFGNKKIW